MEPRLCLSLITAAQFQTAVTTTTVCLRLVFSARKSEHITPLPRELHWLKVPEIIHFQLCVLAYRCLTGTVPSPRRTLHLTADVGSRRRRA